MILVDSHTHIYLSEFALDIDTVIDRAKNEGVKKIFLPAIDSSHHQEMFLLEQRFPDNCFCMMGLHPCSVKENYLQELSLVEEQLKRRKFAAVGEIGLDFYWDKTFAKQQHEAFEQQMQWALDYNLTINIHTRNATQETIELVKPFAKKGLRGTFHCFGGSIETAKQIMNMNFFMGIGGVVTYKKSGLEETLKDVPLEYLILETDAPYLTPVPFRGKRNESSYIKLIAQRVAEIKNISIDEVARVTTLNAEKIFGC
ncbi:MAG: TatD family hydrolase [Chitinophagaceae bacterium]